MRPVTADDHAELLVRFANGAMGAITVSGLTPGGYGMSILVVGTNGALRLDNQDQLWGMQGDSSPTASGSRSGHAIRRRRWPNCPTADRLRWARYFLAQTLAMSLPMGETMLDDAASFYDGLVVQRAMDAARRAHANGTWETL